MCIMCGNEIWRVCQTVAPQYMNKHKGEWMNSIWWIMEIYWLVPLFPLFISLCFCMLLIDQMLIRNVSGGQEWMMESCGGRNQRGLHPAPFQRWNVLVLASCLSVVDSSYFHLSFLHFIYLLSMFDHYQSKMSFIHSFARNSNKAISPL